MIKSVKKAEHYTWGNECDGWAFVKNRQVCVIQEKMPSGTSEKHHFYTQSQQLFYILSGIATFEIEGEVFTVNPQETIHVPKGKKHCITNPGSAELEFLVISAPKLHGDNV